MAQAMAAHLLGDKFNIISAGLMAMAGSPASSHAITVMDERKLKLEKHKSQLVTETLLDSVNLVLTMTASHKEAILHVDKTADKIWTLGEYADSDISISDPYGGDLSVYRACAEEIYELLLKVKDKL